MSRAARLRAGTAAHLREFGRRPLHVVFLLVLPPAVVEIYGVAMAAFPALPGLGAVPATVGRINGAVFAAAFLAGLIGLFQVISARQADDRLALCGFRRWELYVTRLGTVLGVSLVAATAAFAVLAWRIEVAAPVAAFGTLALAGLLYGLVGVLVGALLPRELEGSLVLVFLADFDTFVASGLADVDPSIATLLPLHYPHELFTAAVRDGGVAASDAFAAAGYLLALALLVLAVSVGTDRVGGGGT